MLNENEAHVWIVRAEQISSPSWTHACNKVLVQEERARMEKFVRARDRQNFMIARGLTRIALTGCMPSVAPQAWRFRQTRHGRPEVAQPASKTPLRFNISHTQDLIALVIVSGLDCGIDVERIDGKVKVSELSPHVLSHNEQHHLSGLPDEYQTTDFFRYWTLKEAYTKAIGLGLSFPFDALEFDLTLAPAALVSHAGNNQNGHWQFEQWFASHEHLLALAIRHDHTIGRHIIRLHDSPTIQTIRSML
ncbi:4'-phosphopantetheinyl transferase superfamily protein [Pseudomonas sp. H3(2019)]|uniref:4'-phosphopantetheinyl transferase family protein n=1 Tax=Pseudomonas sp. H3(2019) TaxID=2598724 RepID=UPI00119060FD|nr:4'-phosphopantetheinyl transferase superfamily protein [Pseudomonas sp. H3(2019)]TVT86087.1 4'-phosphopantetheinyl transferase superfamily protein [Pseudomonas sp. H3(2019)]